MMDTIEHYLEQGQGILLDWITSPAAYAQFALLVAAYLLAVFVSARTKPRLESAIRPAEDATTTWALATSARTAKMRNKVAQSWMNGFMKLSLPSNFIPVHGTP